MREHWYILLSNLTTEQIDELKRVPGVCKGNFLPVIEDCFGFHEGHLDFWWSNSIDSSLEIKTFEELQQKLGVQVQ